MQNYPPFSPISKSEMIELFLCDVRRQIRSIVSLCEEFGVRCTRAKRANQNDCYLFLIICATIVASQARVSPTKTLHSTSARLRRGGSANTHSICIVSPGTIL